MKTMVKTQFTTSITAAIVLLLVSCDPRESQQLAQGFFPHQPHIENELSCDTCHELQETGITMPTMEACTTCHDLTDDTYFGTCNECHSKNNVTLSEENVTAVVNHQELFAKFIPENWYDVQYNHTQFLDEDTDCLVCHQGVTQSRTASLENLPSMEAAMAYHDQMGYSNECSVCHTELTVFTEPPSHDRSWKDTHGRYMEFQDDKTCMLCHQEETCFTCHRTEKPRSHTALFRLRTHGIQAGFDRSKCMVCHREDECESCHRAQADPMPPAPFHTPDASCLSCHGQLASFGPNPRPPQRFMKPMPHRMMMGASSETCLSCHQF
ncbi:MAG: cytochrome c3 family protein [bacterium]|jgi:hypothetical protein